MSPTTAKSIVRTLGTLAGLLGLLMLPTVATVLPGMFRGDGIPLAVALSFGFFGLLLVGYCLYAGWLVWFRWSPLAVQHVCGLVAFVIFTQLSRFMMPKAHGSHVEEANWVPAAFLGLLLLTFVLYRVAKERLSRILFPTALPLGEQP